MSKASRLTAVSAALLLLAAFLRFPSLTSAAARDAMDFAARRLIPALFPAMAAASLLLQLAPGDALPKSAARILRLPREGAGVLLLGWAAGFPAGAAAAAALKRDGILKGRDAERLAAVSSAPSPAFFIAALGGMWNCPAFGCFLFALHALTMLLLCRAFFRGEGGSRRPACEPRSCAPASAPKAESFFPALSRAVSDAGTACVSVAASVVFFRALCAVLSRLFPALSPLFLLTFEFSAATAHGAELGGAGGALFSGFAVGFSGLAVLAQIARPLSEANLSARPALSARLICGAVLSLGSAAFFLLHPLAPAAPAHVLSDAARFAPRGGLLPGAVMLAVSLAAAILSSGSRKTQK